jgi:inorganic pyrophosphatase
MRMEDNGADDKIISVCASDASVSHYNHIEELPPHFLEELKHFFLRYKELENKSVIIKDFFDEQKAYAIIQEAIESYSNGDWKK